MILRDCGVELRGKVVGREGVEPSTKRLRVGLLNRVSLRKYRYFPPRHSGERPRKTAPSPYDLRGATRLARFGLYHILQVTDPVRGRLELRYVRGWPEPLTVQFCLFEPLACAVLAGTAFEKGRLPRRRVA